MAQRAMSTILKEIAEVKQERAARFRELIGPDRSVHDGPPHEVRRRVRKAEGDDAMLDLDARLEELRAEQREHPDFAELERRWAQGEE
jgi:hypothetical protein